MSLFSEVFTPKVNFSNFDLSRTRMGTCRFGQLVPVFVQEVLPNDYFRITGASSIKFAPMIAPMMHDCSVSFHYFYVPNRIVYKHWEEFITGSRNGRPLTAEQQTTYEAPRLDIAEFVNGISAAQEDTGTGFLRSSLLDSLLYPTYRAKNSTSESLEASDIPLRDYWKIWFDFYRDENLQVEWEIPDNPGVGYDLSDIMEEMFEHSRPFTLDDIGIFYTQYMASAETGTNLVPDSSLYFYRAWKKDYFTAALPAPQKGDPVTLSLAGETQAPVTITGDTYFDPADGNDALSFSADGQTLEQEFLVFNKATEQPTPSIGNMYAGAHPVTRMYASVNLQGTADLSESFQVTVEQLREAFAVQRILEALSMRGSRYIEYLKGFFGTAPTDLRLQRPEFLGGWTQEVMVREVLQNSGYGSDADELPNMTGYAAGRAFSAGSDKVISKLFKEHGYVIGIMSVMPKAYYNQGLRRDYFRFDRFDYYLPQTAHLGEQPIYNKELFAYMGDSEEDAAKNDAIFGYIPRFAEYKTAYNEICGDFRTSLDFYHMSRKFSECPVLSEQFISTNNLVPRPFVVWDSQYPDSDIIWFDVFHKVIASRPMPYHVTPNIM